MSDSVKDCERCKKGVTHAVTALIVVPSFKVLLLLRTLDFSGRAERFFICHIDHCRNVRFRRHVEYIRVYRI